MAADPREGNGQSPAPLTLIDHHVHGVLTSDLDRTSFESLISESGQPAPAGTSHFESPVGLSLRRLCAPVLGLEPHASPEAYLQARADLGLAANELLLAAAGLSGLLVDTGHRSSDVLGPGEMGRIARAPAAEIARVERVAELVAGSSSGPEEFLRLYPAELVRLAGDVAGWKTVVAYRHGFDLETTEPDRRELMRSLDTWYAELGGPGRLDSPVLLRYVLHTLMEATDGAPLPLQVHAGFGDSDLNLHRADPVVFTPWVRLLGEAALPVIFLHCYPYHRQAGYLAEVFPHVYFDVGCILNYTGPSAGRILAEALELSPFTKMLYSSDAFGLAELVYMGAALFRRHLSAILESWVRAGDCTPDDADRIEQLIGHENAATLYGLDARFQEAPTTT